MGSKRSGHGQLDIPLVWDAPPPLPMVEPGEEDPFHPERELPASIGRLMLAALADLGLVFLLLAFFWTLPVVLGAGLAGRQALAAGLAAAEVVFVTFAGLLWGWRATPGMALCRAFFSAPLSLGRSVLLTVFWGVCLPAAGLPLILGRSGRRLLERLAGAAIRSR
jgi:hypothetical protein